MNLEAKKNFILGKFNVGVQKIENSVGHCTSKSQIFSAQENKNVSEGNMSPDIGHAAGPESRA